MLNLSAVLDKYIPDRRPAPAKVATTVTYVVAGRSKRRRRRNQEVLFPTDRVVVLRYYDEDGRLIDTQYGPIGS